MQSIHPQVLSRRHTAACIVHVFVYPVIRRTKASRVLELRSHRVGANVGQDLSEQPVGVELEDSSIAVGATKIAR